MPAEDLIANRYRIERRIARGGQASVYLARQVPLDRKVALKVLTPPPGTDAEDVQTFQERFLLEARTLATLDHPNIVTVYDYGPIDSGGFYIAMEFVEGRRFSELLRVGPMAPERALSLIQQVCSALSYAHQRKVIHRDIKNSNVLIRVDHHGNEQVKVVDFGIAKLMEDDASLTMTGVVMGSPHFMAPEQARGATIDHRVDIYAVGVLLYCGLVGRYPFNGESSREIVSAHLSQEIPRFAEANPDLTLSPMLERTVRRCLAKEPDARFQDVDTLLTALTPFLGDRDSLAMPVVPTDEIPAAASTRRPAWMGLLLVGAVVVALLPVVVLVVVLFILLSPSSSPSIVQPPAEVVVTIDEVASEGSITTDTLPKAEAEAEAEAEAPDPPPEAPEIQPEEPPSRPSAAPVVATTPPPAPAEVPIRTSPPTTTPAEPPPSRRRRR